jgi:hypothetical protein
VAVLPDSPRAVLRLEPHTIPQLRALFHDCLTLLDAKLRDLEYGGRMHDPWMHDPVSVRMKDLYNASVMEAADGGYAALRAYQAELQRTYEALGRMEEEYRRTEEVNEGLFGGRV